MVELNVGHAAPNWNLIDIHGRLVHLKDYLGRKVILFFYPKDDTPGCTLESIAFSKLRSDFELLNTVVFGVSKDDAKSHCSFSDKHGLTVELLTDPDGKTLSDYGAWGEKSNYGKTYMGIIRSTVLIDESGNLLKLWRNVKAAGHAEAVLDFIKGGK